MKYISLYMVTQFAEVISKSDQFTISSYGRLISKNIINSRINEEITENILEKLEKYLNELYFSNSKIEIVKNKLYHILPTLNIDFSEDELFLPKLNQRIQYGIDIAVEDDKLGFVVNISPKINLLNYLNYKLF